MTGDRPFSKQLRYERELRGWSQADLAEKIACDQKTIGRWERGEGIPRPYHRQHLAKLFGKDVEELGLVGENSTKTLPAPLPDHPIASSSFSREDWGEAPDVVPLYGREEEQAVLAHWIKVLRSRVVAIVGVGGVGKTAVAATVARQAKQDLEYVFWRSLQNAPPPEIFLRQCIAFISHQHYANLPGNSDDEISLLISLMRDHRCLLVLDNFDSVLAAGQSAGRFRDGYNAYGRLLQRVGEARHTSCLLITSREKPKEVAQLEGSKSPVRSLPLSGLPPEVGQQVLQDKDLSGSDAQWQALVERYSGNPLALRLVSEPIQELFAGNISSFLEEETLAFGGINDMLAQQFERLSAQERDIMYWLAIEREPVSLDDLHTNLARPISRGIVFETLSSLRRRSLIEPRGPTQFTLQPVILEYVTMRLVERTCEDFDAEVPETWTQFALCKAQAKDYVRDSQVRLLLAPIAQRLLAKSGKEDIAQRARNMLDAQRRRNAQQPGYLAGNLLNLLSHLHSDLRGMDFSHPVIRQAYVQGVMLPEVNFAHAHFISPIFSNTFGNILSVACSPIGHTAAGTSSGDILVYDSLSGTLCLTCRGHSDGVWSLAFSPDGSLLASSSDDANVRLWDSASGECLSLLQGHTNRARSIAFSPDGSKLASGSDDQAIRIWDTRSGRCFQTLQGHTQRIRWVAFSPDGHMLSSSSDDGTIRSWDTQSYRCLHTLIAERPYERMNISHAQGLTETQKANLRVLGAIEEE
ncbi:MAG TPA: helix-turn-helix domain-containing protein [Ktedonobacteraceae bacterium]|nr:helix-turn-helix domain-containing protein [Ktedonobacteraceae bacterium]